jgi:CRP-like cAMP-binding protein
MIQKFSLSFGAKDHTMKEITALSDKIVTLKRNEFLKTSGSVDTNVYYIESGSLRISIFNDCSEQTIRLGYKGNLIVALDSFITGQPSALVIQALKKTNIRIISKHQIDRFLEIESNRILWSTLLKSLLVQQFEREIDLLTESPLNRYNRVLQRSPQLFQEIPNKHIANYLRMSPETLSRLKKS